MKTILNKRITITKGKNGDYGVARTENKLLKTFIGKKAIIKVLI